MLKNSGVHCVHCVHCVHVFTVFSVHLFAPALRIGPLALAVGRVEENNIKCYINMRI